MNKDSNFIIIGAGIAGIATAYYLSRKHSMQNITLIDNGLPMEFTSAQSGENYRNWWPHHIMREFTDNSISLMEEIANETDNRIHITRRGYVLATRGTNIDNYIEQLTRSYDDSSDQQIRFHKNGHDNYLESLGLDWNQIPSGVDVIKNPDVIKQAFPSLDKNINSIIHIRRAGEISSQQLGQFMLEYVRAKGGKVIQAKVLGIEKNDQFKLGLEQSGKKQEITADHLIIAAGPFVNELCSQLGETLPVTNILQQKIAFEDRLKTIPRNLPFTIDMDEQNIDWTDEERELLNESDEFKWLTQQMPGGIHCRPDGGPNGTWVKLGWAYNEEPVGVSWTPDLDDYFPDIVLRGAARLNPELKQYYGKLPRNMSHYGGFYTMTEENWPLIGPMQTEGAYIVGALSGFGTMAACAAGSICAAWATGAELPEYAEKLSLRRYQDKQFMAELEAMNDKGLL